MKDVAVAYSLSEALMFSTDNHLRVPQILCVLNVDKDHKDATLSFGYRMYQLPTCELNDCLQPLNELPTQVVNLGSNQGGQR